MDLYFRRIPDIIILTTRERRAPMGSELQDAVTIDKLEVPYNPNLQVTYKAIAGT